MGMALCICATLPPVVRFGAGKASMRAAGARHRPGTVHSSRSGVEYHLGSGGEHGLRVVGLRPLPGDVTTRRLGIRR